MAALTCEYHVNKASSIRVWKGFLLLPVILLAGCGTQPAKDFGGRWKPVNRFQSSTTEIPLNRPYTYYASPMDETLRNMLTRWSHDTGMTLDYHLASDYTLFAPVTKVRTADLRQAASELSTIYAAQGVSIAVDGGTLRVARPGALGSDTSPVAAPPHAAHPAAAASPSPVTTAGIR